MQCCQPSSRLNMIVTILQFNYYFKFPSTNTLRIKWSIVCPIFVLFLLHFCYLLHSAFIYFLFSNCSLIIPFFVLFIVALLLLFLCSVFVRKLDYHAIYYPYSAIISRISSRKTI